MFSNVSGDRPDDAVGTPLAMRQHSLRKVAQVAEVATFTATGLATRDLLVDGYMQVRVSGIEVDSGDPSPVGHPKIGPRLFHRLAGNLAKRLFAFLVICAEGFEVFLAKADHDVRQVLLAESFAPPTQVSIGLTIGPVFAAQVVALLRKQLTPVTFTLANDPFFRDVTSEAGGALSPHRFNGDDDAHDR